VCNKPRCRAIGERKSTGIRANFADRRKLDRWAGAEDIMSYRIGPVVLAARVGERSLLAFFTGI
jgi:hypothetical protein